MMDIREWLQYENIITDYRILDSIITKLDLIGITNIQILKQRMELETSFLYTSELVPNIFVQKLINHKLCITKDLKLLTYQEVSLLLRYHFPTYNYYQLFEQYKINGSMLVDLLFTNHTSAKEWILP